MVRTLLIPKYIVSSLIGVNGHVFGIYCRCVFSGLRGKVAKGGLDKVCGGERADSNPFTAETQSAQRKPRMFFFRIS